MVVKFEDIVRAKRVPHPDQQWQTTNMTGIKEHWQKAAVSLLAALILWQLYIHAISRTRSPAGNGRGYESWCPLPDAAKVSDYTDGLKPSSDLTLDLSLKTQVERLSAAVKCQTESFDDNGDVDVDPRWKTFDTFHEVLADLFPIVHAKATLEKVDRCGLVFTLKGSSDGLKPILLTAHQDVVPASSISKWTHPPFEPYYDGHYLWGRGSSDCKNNLIGVMSVVESLLQQDWIPRRSVVLAFGFDEETGGVRGAAQIALNLEVTWGRDGFDLILDEGGMGLTTVGDYVYARPGVAEKGYMDAVLKLEVNGGHSSRPPRHNGIGIMAEMIVALEEHPFSPVLTRENPLRGYLECQAKYTPHELEPWLRRGLEHNDDGKELGKKLAQARGPTARFSMQTSQAVDIIRGGSKVNALPEDVTATVNYRVAPHDSLDIVKNRISALLQPIAVRHGLNFLPFGHNRTESGHLETRSDSTSSAAGTLILSSLNDLSPSPITPTDIQNEVWHTFSATIRQVFEDTESLSGKTVIPVGDIMQGNTDTIQYEHLTRNIYRFSPRREGTAFGVHTIDEHIDIVAHLEGMRFYYDLIQNFDRADF